MNTDILTIQLPTDEIIFLRQYAEGTELQFQS
jgi:hypothetical protein